MNQRAENKEFNFTMANLEVLPTPAKDTYYFDAEQRNLAFLVTDNGHKSFYFWRKVRGQKVRLQLGRFPDLPLKEARRMCGEMLQKVAKREDVVAERREQREEKTLNQFFEDFLRRHAKPHKKSWAYDEANYRNHVAGVLGNKRLTQVTNAAIQHLHEKIGEERGQVIANRVLALLVVVYNKAAEWKVTPKGFEAPTRYVKKFREKTRDRFLQGEELPLFFAALDADPNQTFHDYVWVSLLTGVRKSDVLAMKWHDVDLARAQWRLPETKNGDPLLLPLVDDVVHILQRRKKGATSIFVFPGEGRTGHFADPKKAWQRLRKVANLLAWEENPATARLVQDVKKANPEATPLQLHNLCQTQAKKSLTTLPVVLHDLHIHDMRRTLGSWQTIAGASPFIVGRSLGHKDLKSTQIYARLNLDPVKASVTKAAELMRSMGEKK